MFVEKCLAHGAMAYVSPSRAGAYLFGANRKAETARNITLPPLWLVRSAPRFGSYHL